MCIWDLFWILFGISIEFDSIGFDPIGFDSIGFDSIGFDSIGVDSIGFDSIGFDSIGFHIGAKVSLTRENWVPGGFVLFPF